MVFFSLVDKMPEFRYLVFAGCCRMQRGEEQLVAAYKAALRALVLDVDKLTTDDSNCFEVYSLLIDTLTRLYQEGSIKDCLGAAVCARQIHHANTDEDETPGVMWPIHEDNARHRDLTKLERASLTMAEQRAAPTKKGHLCTLPLDERPTDPEPDMLPPPPPLLTGNNENSIA
jgi:hypothetical protein